MILFSSLKHIVILFLFVYMGLISGLFYAVITRIDNFVTKKALKKPLNQKKSKKRINVQEIQIEQKQKQIKQKKAPTKQRFKRQKIKNKLICKNFCKKVFCLIVHFLPSVAFFVCVAVSYQINYKLNFGSLRLGYVLIWIVSFFVAKRIYNLLANYFVAFYNWIIKRIKSNGGTQR